MRYPRWVEKVKKANEQISRKEGYIYERWKQGMIEYYKKRIKALENG